MTGAAADLLPILTFWHGPLSWLERLCLKSLQRQGHPVAVYAYARPEGLPDGVEWRDAAQILPAESLTFYKGKGTVAVFSDRFRLELLRRGLGLWADADVFALKPLVLDTPYLFGFERGPRPGEKSGSVNNAVLHIPADSPLLADLLAVFAPGRRPLFEPFLPPVRRFEVALRRVLGDPVPPEAMQFGATGPFPLTHYIRARNLLGQVAPVPVYYPVAYEDVPLLLTASDILERRLRPETRALHIWRSQLTNRGRAGLATPAPGSPLARLCADLDVKI